MSPKVTTDGKPVLMKNRDDSDSWEQEVKYYKGKNHEIGGNMSVVKWGINKNILSPYPDNINAGGVNEAGFAVTNANVIGKNPLHELTNSTIALLNESLEECVTVDDFEKLLNRWHENNKTKTINGVFGIIDAFGGAAIFEIISPYIGSPLRYERFDADDAYDDNGNFLGFVVRTNKHQWSTHHGGVDRHKRAYNMLKSMSLNNRLSYKTVMQEVARDVCGDVEKIYRNIKEPASKPVQVELDPNRRIYATSTYIDNFYTGFCISRYNTNVSIIVRGVKKYESPGLTTMWVSLGEPSVGVFTPYFPASKNVPLYAWADKIPKDGKIIDKSSASVFNSAIVELELSVYSNNKLSTANIDGIKRYAMDKTINYEKVLEIQKWSLPLEDLLIEKTEDFLNCIRSNGSHVDNNNLFDFSDYATNFAYKDYMGYKENFSYFSTWDFTDICNNNAE